MNNVRQVFLDEFIVFQSFVSFLEYLTVHEFIILASYLKLLKSRSFVTKHCFYFPKDGINPKLTLTFSEITLYGCLAYPYYKLYIDNIFKKEFI